MIGFLNTKLKEECSGCSACSQVCPFDAIQMIEDEEGFLYPNVNAMKCVNCNLCHTVCPYENPVDSYEEKSIAFGGYIKNEKIRDESTSGGAFSAIVDGWCDDNYVIFGAKSDGLRVYHDFITDKNELFEFRKSKYSQSDMGDNYNKVKEFLKKGYKVLFSGTPCQIAALKSFLRRDNTNNLLTVEVICEGVPTPLFVRKYNKWLLETYNSSIEKLDYRYKDTRVNKNKAKWDFQIMFTKLKNGKEIKKDRWFNPFWSIWLNHLMSRPSCYKCPYTKKNRNADITLGDLWGVHLYCPELYANNTGCSLIVCNSAKGKDALEKARHLLYGHELDFDTALKYQSPMRKTIDYNPDREKFMKDIQTMDYKKICDKWATKPSLKLLWSKYVWGNRQKIWYWNLKNKK